jgi:EAL domain-containing protein (putative c-di-GMP-specific phosphodiesterase class I)
MNPMPFPALNDYLQRLSDPSRPPAPVWVSANGQVQGRFFNCVLTSAFQQILDVDGGVLGFEGLARGVSEADAGLSLWRMLDHAADDDESVELDRLCRMLHAINFFRQNVGGATDLYVSVHDRLLSGVSSNHGYAFQRILAALGLPIGQIVLQLPAVSPARRWLVNYVADNYRRNGFRLALNVATPAEAFEVIGQVAPFAVKIDARVLEGDHALGNLLELAHAAGTKVIFRRVESASTFATLERASRDTGVPAYVQGNLIDPPSATLSADTAYLPAPPEQRGAASRP